MDKEEHLLLLEKHGRFSTWELLDVCLLRRLPLFFFFFVKVPLNLCGVYASEFMNILNVGIKLEDNRLQIRIDAEGSRVAARFTPLNANRPQAYRLTLGTCPVFFLPHFPRVRLNFRTF